MKTILYATDYSQNSISALRLAHILAEQFRAKLIVMHVFDLPLSLASPVTISYMNKEKRRYIHNRAKLKAFYEAHLGDSWKNSDIKVVVDENGSVPDGILENAFSLEADLMVVGTKGASQIKEFFLGSTAKALIRKASCPVLAVPSNSEVTSLQKMVYATDFEQADIFAINKLVKIAQKFDSEIRIVHITTQKEYAGKDQMEWFKEKLKEKIAYDKLEFDLIFSETIFEELVSYLKNSDADILAMMERKDNNFYEKYLQPDMVKKMVKAIDIPLLSFNVGGL